MDPELGSSGSLPHSWLESAEEMGFELGSSASLVQSWPESPEATKMSEKTRGNEVRMVENLGVLRLW
jgi:hypothetical protein